RSYHFFPRTSLRPSISKVCFETIRCSRAFSISSSLRRLSSDASSPEYFCFHLKNVGDEIPYFLQISDALPSCAASLRIATIFSSEYFPFFMSAPFSLLRADHYTVNGLEFGGQVATIIQKIREIREHPWFTKKSPSI